MSLNWGYAEYMHHRHFLLILNAIPVMKPKRALAFFFGSEDPLKDKRLAANSPKALAPLPWTPSISQYPRSSFPVPMLNVVVAQKLESAEAGSSVSGTPIVT